MRGRSPGKPAQRRLIAQRKRWSDGSIRLNPEINIGVAMAIDGGAVAAVIHEADRTKLGEIAVQRRDLTERARAYLKYLRSPLPLRRLNPQS